MDRFWINWAEGTDGGKHHHHYLLKEAKQEAERLARLEYNQGKAVCLFECIAICRAEPSPVEWEIPR